MIELFESESLVHLGPQAALLRSMALPIADELLTSVLAIEAAAPFRNMVTPGGFTMSVALTNCGRLGWTTDRRGYRYSETDPVSGKAWPPIPEVFEQLARSAAQAVGFEEFAPDACLLNRYVPGAYLSLHQDRNEQDFSAPIVSVSLGVAATFLFGGLRRNDKVQRIRLEHGDVVVWGGVDRLRFHGVAALKSTASGSVLGDTRINLTLRRAGASTKEKRT